MDIFELLKQGSTNLFISTFEKENIDVNFEDEYGHSLLDLACEEGNYEIVKYLVDKKAKIERDDCPGTSPLMISCYRGNLKIIKLLLESGANIEKESFTGWTPLTYATHHSRYEVAKELILEGANTDEIISPKGKPLNDYTRNLLLNFISSLNVGVKPAKR